MTKRECEKQLADLMELAFRVLKEYNQDCNHLSMFASHDGSCVMGYIGRFENVVYCYKETNGNYIYGEEAKE